MLSPTTIAWTRIVVATAVLLTLANNYLLGTAGFNPFDFFGYFTNLTSLLSSALLVTIGLATLRRGGADLGSRVPLAYVRAVAVSCMLIVGVIYTVLVPGTGAAPPWASAILHVVFPAYMLLDWICVGDRPPLAWRRVWLVLPYPIVWLVVVLARGATDGWVPYGFLLPERGAAALLATVAGLLGALAVSGAIVWGLSRRPVRHT
ncbi:Pr6Pr family membrane protein [Leucobacter sp. NPDC058333]|uniref:Pr6Pr family membrane protein n=1 Tax=Leucobacter sp. NPDC058333 TaxID=3346450 RepID=UPI0036540075